MADRYLDSGSASEASPYESTSTAAHQLFDFDSGVLDIAAGETIWVSNAHSETGIVGNITSSTNASATNPQKLICVSDLGTNTTLASSAICSYASSWVIEGFWYIYGVLFTTTTTTNQTFGIGSSSFTHKIHLDNCTVYISSSSTMHLYIGSSGSTNNDETRLVFTSLTYRPRNAANTIKCRHGDFNFNNLVLDSGGTAPTSLFSTNSGTFSNILIEDSDLTGLDFTNLLAPVSSGSASFLGRNLKLPSSCTAYCTAFSGPGNSFCLIDFTANTTRIPFYYRYYSGEIVYESAIMANSTSDRLYLRNDESDSGYSIKMVAGNNSFTEPLYSPWIDIEVEDTSTAITPYAEILVSGDGASALKDNEAWIEVDAMTGSYSNATRYDDAPTIIDAGTDQAAGTITWTGHGYSSPRTHKLALGSTITPGVKGLIRLRVGLGKSSSTLYVGKVGYN